MIGVDITEISRIRQVIDRQGDRFLQKVFTPTEQSYCNQFKNKYERYAARFAAKEAVAKLISEGPRSYWLDIEVVNLPSGKPTVKLSPRLQVLVAGDIEISLSHSETSAIAVAMLAASRPAV